MNNNYKGSVKCSAQLLGQIDGRNADWMLAEEQPIAIRINGEIYAVMLATPLNLEDFARGFCLSEGLIKSTNAISSIALKRVRDGYEVRITISDQAYDRIQIIDKRRRLAGASGCGICGLTSLSHVVEELPKIENELQVSVSAINQAKQNLEQHTPLNGVNFSVHAAAFANEQGEILLVREDVGRHNALDKLFGALAAGGIDAGSGFIIITSRFAYELAQKCIRLRVPIVVAISAPTSMAVEIAIKADMSFAAFSGEDNLMIFSCKKRIF